MGSGTFTFENHEFDAVLEGVVGPVRTNQDTLMKMCETTHSATFDGVLKAEFAFHTEMGVFTFGARQLMDEASAEKLRRLMKSAKWVFFPSQRIALEAALRDVLDSAPVKTAYKELKAAALAHRELFLKRRREARAGVPVIRLEFTDAPFFGVLHGDSMAALDS